MATVETVAAMAKRQRLGLTDAELAAVLAIVESTGNFAPADEVVLQFTSGALSRDALTFFLPHIWRYRPDDSPIPADVWRAMFQQARYTEDGIVKSRPRGVSRAYRGATEENREGLSWSLDVGQARYFARSRQAPRVTSARVWVANIPADREFARFMDGWEKEITADVRGLEIFPIEEVHRLPKLPWWRRLNHTDYLRRVRHPPPSDW